MNDLDAPSPKTETKPTTGLLRIHVKLHTEAFDRAMETMRAFDECFRRITETTRLWPEMLELCLLDWPWPNWTFYRRRPYDQEIDD